MGPEESTTSNTAEARNQLMKRRNEYLIHACACRDPTCSKPFCIKMKHLLRHARDCKQRSTGKCTACNFFLRICAAHAHECKETKCPVPICANLKQKMRERRERQQKEQTHMPSNIGMPNQGDQHQQYMGIIDPQQSQYVPSPAARSHTDNRGTKGFFIDLCYT